MRKNEIRVHEQERRNYLLGFSSGKGRRTYYAMFDENDQVVGYVDGLRLSEEQKKYNACLQRLTTIDQMTAGVECIEDLKLPLLPDNTKAKQIFIASNQKDNANIRQRNPKSKILEAKYLRGEKIRLLKVSFNDETLYKIARSCFADGKVNRNNDIVGAIINSIGYNKYNTPAFLSYVRGWDEQARSKHLPGKLNEHLYQKLMTSATSEYSLFKEFDNYRNLRDTYLILSSYRKAKAEEKRKMEEERAQGQQVSIFDNPLVYKK